MARPRIKKAPCPIARALWDAHHRQPTHATRNALFTHYWPHVQRIARFYASNNRYVDAEECAQDAFFGLVAAFETFSPERGVPFETYFYARVRGAIVDALRQRDWVPRLVRQRQEPVAQVSSLAQSFFTDDNHRPVPLEKLLPLPYAPCPLDAAEFWSALLRGLNQRQRLVMLLLYRERLTMREVATELGFSESRVSQMHAEIIGLLRSTRMSWKFSTEEIDRTIAELRRTIELLERLRAACAPVQRRDRSSKRPRATKVA